WRTDAASTVGSGVWIALAGLVLLHGTRRIRAAQYATSRRKAYRVGVKTNVYVDGIPGELVDISVGGAALRFPASSMPRTGLVELELPNAPAVKAEMVRVNADRDRDVDLASIKVVPGDWNAYRTMSLWMFDTTVDGIPVVARKQPV